MLANDRPSWIWRVALVGLLLGLTLLGLFSGDVSQSEAQESTPPPSPLIDVTTCEPRAINAETEGTVSIFGTNFTAATTVRLVGFGLLPVTFVNGGALTVTVPGTVPPGSYTIQVTNPGAGFDNCPQPLEIRAVLPPPPTFAPPTPQPGEPNLIVRNFSANPPQVAPGQPVTLTFEVFNQGNRPAQGVSVSVDAGGVFVPADGQASALLPDIGVGAGTSVTLNVVAAQTAEPGPTSVPLTFTYRDFSGQNYTRNVVLSVTIQQTAQPVARLTLARYLSDPSPVVPGEPVTLTVLLTNTGDAAAVNSVLRIGGEEGVLLAGPQGDSFPVGDVAPGESVGLELPLVTAAGAEAGPRAQPYTLEFFANGETQSVTGTITLVVAPVVVNEPVLLLSAYDTGREEPLQPGEQFTLSLTLQNVGTGGASNLLVTFGTVESTGSGGSGGGSGSFSPSSTFAPLGSGGTVFLGSIAPDGEAVTIEQAFIVDGTVESGIYSLPVTLTYQNPDGSDGQTNLRASVVVVVPPNLQRDLQGPLPDETPLGEPVFVGLEITNNGEATVNLTTITLTTDNGEVVEGAETVIGALLDGDSTTYSGVVLPEEAGPVTLTLTINYIDDLNNRRSIVETYELTAVEPPPLPDVPDIPFEPEPPEPEPEPETDSSDFIGRLLLGLLGLGS